MSVFLLIFISSLLCYSQARPQETAVASSTAEAAIVSSGQDTGSNDSSGTPPNNPYQDQINGFLNAMNSAMNTYLKPMMSNMTDTEQTQLINLGMEGCASYVNYMVYIMSQRAGVTSTISAPEEIAEEVIIEFESLEPFVPGIPKSDTDTTN